MTLRNGMYIFRVLCTFLCDFVFSEHCVLRVVPLFRFFRILRYLLFSFDEYIFDVNKLLPYNE